MVKVAWMVDWWSWNEEVPELSEILDENIWKRLRFLISVFSEHEYLVKFLGSIHHFAVQSNLPGVTWNKSHQTCLRRHFCHHRCFREIKRRKSVQNKSVKSFKFSQKREGKKNIVLDGLQDPLLRDVWGYVCLWARTHRAVKFPYKHKVEQNGAILNLDFSLSFPCIRLKVSLLVLTLHVKQFHPE